MKTKAERKARRQTAIAALKSLFISEVKHTLRAPDAEDIQAALVLSSAIGAWALSGFDPEKGKAIREAWEAFEAERADTP